MALPSGTCAYCRRSLLVAGAKEEDHPQPRAQATGAPDDGRTVASCGRCNRLKGAATHGTDPFTHRVERLFDPRSMQWDRHFARHPAGLTVGTTPTGRATAALLFRSTDGFPVDPGPWPYRELTDDLDAHFVTARAIVAYQQNRWIELEHLISGMLEGAEDATSGTRDYLLRIGVWLDGSLATKRASPADRRSGGLQYIDLLPDRSDVKMRRHLAECQTASFDHARHWLPLGLWRERLTRAAALGYLRMAHAFPWQSVVYTLRAATIAALPAELWFPRRTRDELRETALSEAAQGRFSSVALLLDLLAQAPSTRREHEALASGLAVIAPTSGVGQGLDLVEESILRRAQLLSLTRQDAALDERAFATLFAWTVQHGMFNEAAELVDGVQRMQLSSRAATAVTAEARDRLVAGRARI